MFRLFVLLLLTLSTLSACKMQWKYGESSSGCIVVDGKKREFRYFIPNHAKGVVLPLIVGLHGGGGNSKRFEKYSRFSELSKKSASFIVVYPQGYDKHWNDGRDSLDDGIDDVEFISRLIDIMPHVEKEEVYVAGMSNGGLMTQRLACEIPEKLNGVAIVGATMSQLLSQECKIQTPLKTVLFFGDKDTAFLDNGNLVSPLNQSKVRAKHIGIKNTLKYWSGRNGCETHHVEKELNNYNKKWGKHKDDGTVVFVNEYDGCKSKLRFYDIKGGGHRWPDSEASNGFILRKTFNVGNASHEIDAADEIVNFFGLIKVN